MLDGPPGIEVAARVHRKFHRTNPGGNITLEASANHSSFKTILYI